MHKQQLLFIVLALVLGFLGGAFFGSPRFRSGYNMMGYPAGTTQMPIYNDNAERYPMTSRQMMDGMNAKLEGKTGTELDEAFLETMIIHHMGAVQMAQKVITTSKRPELIKLANDIV